MPIITLEKHAWDDNPPHDEKRRAIVAKWQELTAQRAALEQEYARETDRLSNYGQETARTMEKIHALDTADAQARHQREANQAAVNIARTNAQQAEQERRRQDIERITGRKLF